jgi:AGZA family xanthine/uracil permease-like MFS transporter
MPLRWFVRGDLDGLVGLFIDNLLLLFLILSLVPPVCGIPVEIVVSHILPAAALSILVGNLFYAWQGRRLALRTGRTDVTALPFGINTVSLMAYLFLIMGPLWQKTHDADLVWSAGIFACWVGGILELLGAFLADPLRRWLPRAALLAPLAGIALTFIAMPFVFKIYANPAIALFPMLLVLFAYAGKIRLPRGIPAGLAAILLGTLVAWTLHRFGLAPTPPPLPTSPLGFYLPHPAFDKLFAFFQREGAGAFFSVIFPMALFNVIGSLQNLESAEASGDRYATRSSLSVNGLSTLLAAFLGSPFPTTIYIGHPGWKAMGARTGYSTVNGILLALICLSGATGLVLRFIPLEVTLGILLWVGIVITAQAFSDTPAKHALAVAVGLIPCLAGWAALIVETTVRSAGSSLSLVATQSSGDLVISGLFALSQGFLLSSILLAAMVAFVIDHRFLAAASVALVSACLSSLGLIHGVTLTPEGAQALTGWWVCPSFTLAYIATSLVLFGLFFLHRNNPREKTHP